jgi:hypothetical protein
MRVGLTWTYHQVFSLTYSIGHLDPSVELQEKENQISKLPWDYGFVNMGMWWWPNLQPAFEREK